MEKEMIDNIPVPQSLEDAYKFFDEFLTDEDKKAILDGDDMHFGLGLWIRNEWIYSKECEEFEPLVNEIESTIYKDELQEVPEIPGSHFKFSLLAGNPDMMSSSLIDLYRQHLENSFK